MTEPRKFKAKECFQYCEYTEDHKHLWKVMLEPYYDNVIANRYSRLGDDVITMPSVKMVIVRYRQEDGETKRVFKCLACGKTELRDDTND